MSKEMSIESLYANGMGIELPISNNDNKQTQESYDCSSIIDLQSIENDLSYLNVFNTLDNTHTNDMIKLHNKLNKEYGKHNKSLESYLDTRIKSMESGISDKLTKILDTIIKTLIKFWGMVVDFFKKIINSIKNLFTKNKITPENNKTVNENFDKAKNINILKVLKNSKNKRGTEDVEKGFDFAKEKTIRSNAYVESGIFILTKFNEKTLFNNLTSLVNIIDNVKNDATKLSSIKKFDDNVVKINDNMSNNINNICKLFNANSDSDKDKVISYTPFINFNSSDKTILKLYEHFSGGAEFIPMDNGSENGGDTELSKIVKNGQQLINIFSMLNNLKNSGKIDSLSNSSTSINQAIGNIGKYLNDNVDFFDNDDQKKIMITLLKNMKLYGNIELSVIGYITVLSKFSISLYNELNRKGTFDWVKLDYNK